MAPDSWGWIAWGASALIFGYILIDFFIVNAGNSESLLLSSREGVDELFPETAAKKD
jgi:hypothetical protein